MRGNRAAGLLAAGVLVLAMLGVGRGLAFDGRAHPRQLADGVYTANPLAGWKLFPTASNPAVAEVARFRARGMAHDAELMQRIAVQPMAAWLTQDWNTSFTRSRRSPPPPASRAPPP